MLASAKKTNQVVVCVVFMFWIEFIKFQFIAIISCSIRTLWMAATQMTNTWTKVPCTSQVFDECELFCCSLLVFFLAPTWAQPDWAACAALLEEFQMRLCQTGAWSPGSVQAVCPVDAYVCLLPTSIEPIALVHLLLCLLGSMHKVLIPHLINFLTVS